MLTVSSNAKTATQDFKKHKTTRKNDTTKEHNNFSVTNSTEMDIYKLSDTELIIVLRKINKFHESTDSQLNEIRKIIQEKNEFKRQIKIIKNQKEILEQKNTMTEIKYAIHNFES